MRKKKFLFMQDSTVQRSKASLESLIASHQLERCEFIAFPYQASSLSYIAVDGAHLLDCHMTTAEMTYQLSVRKQSIHEPGLGGQAYLEELDMVDDRVWTYHPVTSMVEGIEAFYVTLMNFFNYASVVTAQQNEVEDNDWCDFIEMEQCRIRLFDHGKLIDEYTFHRDQNDLPFEMANIQMVATEIAEKFGILTESNSRYRFGKNMPVAVWHRGDKLTWKRVPVLELTHDVYRVFYPSCNGFLGFTMEEYSDALAIGETHVFIHIIESMVGEKPSLTDYNYLSFTAYYDIDRWHTNVDEYETAACYDLFAPNAIDLKAFTFYEAMDTIELLEHLPYFFKAFAESYKASLAVSRQTDITKHTYAPIILGEIHAEVQLENPAEQNVCIVTDSWQETQPTATELLTLLRGLESGLKLDD